MELHAGENLIRGSGPYKVKGATTEKLCRYKILHTHTHTYPVLPAHCVMQQRIIFIKKCKSGSTDEKEPFCCKTC